MSWYRSRQYAKARSTGNPFLPWLAQLRKPAGPAPKRIADHQFYMHHADFADKVTEEFNRTWPAEEKDEAYSLAHRNKVAIKLLEQEPPSVRARLEVEITEEYEKQKAAHKAATSGLPSVDPADRAT